MPALTHSDLEEGLGLATLLPDLGDLCLNFEDLVLDLEGLLGDDLVDVQLLGLLGQCLQISLQCHVQSTYFLILPLQCLYLEPHVIAPPRGLPDLLQQVIQPQLLLLRPDLVGPLALLIIDLQQAMMILLSLPV